MTDISLVDVRAEDLCTQCGEEPFKYKCPGVPPTVVMSAHVASSAASRTRRSPGAQDITGVAENAERRMQADGSKRGKAKQCQRLLSAARQACVMLELMSPGMLRRKQNSSVSVKGGQMIKWHVELRFNSTDVIIQEKFVPDSRTLLEVLEGALVCKPGEAKVHLQLDAYVQATAQQCKLFLQKERVPAGRPRLKALASSSTIREALQGACIIEFPVLHVYLASDAPQIT